MVRIFGSIQQAVIIAIRVERFRRIASQKLAAVLQYILVGVRLVRVGLA
jgi:hypothetical protein